MKDRCIHAAPAWASPSAFIAADSSQAADSSHKSPSFSAQPANTAGTTSTASWLSARAQRRKRRGRDEPAVRKRRGRQAAVQPEYVRVEVEDETTKSSS